MLQPNTHILSAAQFNRTNLESFFELANQMVPYAKAERLTTVLEGALLANLFFEPSTRTRLSFSAAFSRLGGKVIETTDKQNSSITKGESLRDTARVVSGYVDVIVLRHPQAGAALEFANASHVPVINGGDGTNEHPTQALLDIYTLQKELHAKNKSLDGLRLALIGDLKHGRTVHSLVKLLNLFLGIHFILISPPSLALPNELLVSIKEAGHTLTIAEQLLPAVSDVDAIYMTRLQEERFSSTQEAHQYRGRLQLNRAFYQKYCQPDTIIMHPLPRDARPEAKELSEDLDEHANLAIFRQTDNGLLIRMALFCALFGVAEQVERFAREISWRKM
ncbi:MAG: aspartate carbamoyltransferase [Gammaproteobacteria bacterium]